MESPQYLDQPVARPQSLAELSKYFVISKPRGRKELLEEIYGYYDKTLPLPRFCIKMNMALQGSKDAMRDLHYVLSVAKDMARRGHNFSAYITQYFK